MLTNLTTKKIFLSEMPDLYTEVNPRENPLLLDLQFNKIIRQNQEEYKTLLEHLPLIVARVDTNSQHLYINPIIFNDTAIPPQEFIGKTFREVGLPNDFCILWETNFSYVFSTGKEAVFESNFINQQGEHYYYQCRILPEYNQKNKIQSALYTLMNITEHKRLEAKLYQQNQEFQAVLENTPDIISRIDKAMRITFINSSIIKLTGIAPKEFIDKALNELFCLDKNTVLLWEKNVERVFTTKKHTVFEYEYPGLHGIRYFHARIVPEFGTDGSVEYALCTSRDITTHKNLTTEMARLDRLNLVGEMAASIGHEVRNPMTTVRGFLQMMSLKKEYKKNTDVFNIMIEELDRANSIISEFLSLAKDKSVHLKEVNLNTIITTLTPLMQANAIVDNKSIHHDLTEIPNLLLDEKEIRQLILNLVNNGLDAMKSGGKIYIRTFAYDNTVALAIQDEGHGIPKDIIKKIGTPFFTTKEAGTGLGLAVCYSIANRHNATIQPITGPHGTTFYILFPINNIDSDEYLSLSESYF
ncbi:MAG: sensor signal transduction histidine kinase [Pelosinus sp.]|jgi:PAS domain S-box-containing protein|nr:sensor signal transduction histidine kinase [Pelosinus sp.]